MAKLHARARLLADVDAGLIDVVIMADMSRFSRREGHEVVAELKQLASKCAVYFYETGERFSYRDIGEKVASFVRAESNADYRRKISIKTHAALRAKAERGEVTGALPFGYRRQGTSCVVYEPEAKVVREIYQRYAAGEGFKKIAAAMNWKKAATPRPRPGKKARWSTSNVRSILLQPRYRGMARWNRLQQHDADGNAIFKVNDDSEVITQFDPSWRIVDESVADVVDAKFADPQRPTFHGKSGGAPGARTKYLLSGGMLLCPTCGGYFEALKGAYYVCSTRRHAGTAACTNKLALRMATMDDAVLRFLSGQVLHSKLVDDIVALAADPDRGEGARERLQEEYSSLSKRIAALVLVAEETPHDQIKDIAARLKTLNDERKKVQLKLKALPSTPSRSGLRDALLQRCDEWREVLTKGYPVEARWIVKQLIGPITLWHGTGLDTTFEPLPGFDPDDQTGKENIDWSDLGFRAMVTPGGLLAGVDGAFRLVAGAGFDRS